MTGASEPSAYSASPPDRAPNPSWLQPWAVLPIALFVVFIAVHFLLMGRLLSADAESVERSPYESARRTDEILAAHRRFADADLRIETRSDPGGVTLTLVGPTADLDDAAIGIYRPDARGLDRRVRWEDPAAPLRCTLSRPGLWILDLRARRAGEALAHRLRVRVPKK